MRKEVTLMLALPLLLASCTEAVPEAEISEVATIESSEVLVSETSATETEATYDLASVNVDYVWQLQVILDNSGVWELLEEDEVDPDWYCAYAITDLDNDGLLEVCKRAVYNNGPVTRLWIYEVTDEESIVRLESEIDEGLDYVSSNYPEFNDDEPIAFYQSDDGTYCYLVHDSKSYGLTSVYVNYEYMALIDNIITINDVCFWHSENACDVVTFFDGDGNEISESEYSQLFEEYEERATGEVYIDWFYEISMDNLIESFEVWNALDS